MILERLGSRYSGLLFVPYLAGSRSPDWNPSLRGLLYGLDLGVSREDIIQSVLEGVGFWIKHMIEIFEETGNKIEEVRAGGGGTWSRVKANVTGVRYVETVDKDTSALGAAILAGVGSGIFKDFESAVKTMVHIDKIFVPDPYLAEKYKSYYKLWRELVNIISEFAQKTHA
ncbi:FGGY-family carbohydrate kinase [Thermogladius sp. 4427co]|uniref:FGGY-family carbohydrate kinase n=1 Tax=Thermogladius sp. 4427co TaxID=3450718 RepID=UPI003F795468